MFTRTISVDADAMFTVADSDPQPGRRVPCHPGALRLGQRQVSRPKARTAWARPRSSTRAASACWAASTASRTAKYLLQDQAKYPKWKKDKPIQDNLASKGGWIGMTDKYWLAALVPEQSEMIKGRFVGEAGQRRRRL